MQSEFWFERWNNNEIGFHEPEANPVLVNNLHHLALKPEARLLLPLCGKTLDIAWLLAQGYQVVGVELCEAAIEQLFSELNVKPSITQHGKLKHYGYDNLDIWVGDFFQLSQRQLGLIDAIFDRGSLVALPETMRHDYSQHLLAIAPDTAQLLVCYDYDQNLRAGPPFAISNDELAKHYGEHYQLTLLESRDVKARFAAECEMTEKVWSLVSN